MAGSQKSRHISLSAFAFCKPVHGIQGLLMPLPKLDKSQGSSLGQNVLGFIHPSLLEQNSSYTCNTYRAKIRIVHTLHAAVLDYKLCMDYTNSIQRKLMNLKHVQRLAIHALLRRPATCL